ncbi:restriction endonuclease subunit S [Lacinutrix neustonica]|uniref:Restriction endonuclease subunit S n=1 Tax=Lacinutrix neustonica TaxID=2980107 RepID=A0A9E8MVI3_9FLAO|nr:restriction endonuclease subunit S [Lacinutrix neustonica]WAC02258.1 restriction endonuclease subunit S [Lacinutrix neustonica]
MNSWVKLQIGKAISFNPPESILKGSIAKKIPMGSLTEFQRKINSFEFNSYNSGPKFRNGDTVMAKITPCLENGKTAFVDVLDENEVAFGSSEFTVLRETEYTDPLFIYYLAISPTFRKRAISCMEGTSGRKRVSEKTLKYYELDFPPIQTQKQIAKVLSDLDAKIEVNNKINQELEAMAKTLYNYWFVQFDFPTSEVQAKRIGNLSLVGKPYKSSRR